jgi:hypothetical protein
MWGYLDLYGLTVTTGDTPAVCVSTTTSCTLSDLTNGASYQFTVTASNQAGTGEASASSATAVPSTVPGLPTDLTASIGSDGQPVLTWTAPNETGGDPIGSYQITGYTGSNSTSVGVVACDQITVTSCSMSGLTAGTAYSFKVQARNGSGLSSASLLSDPIIPVTTPGAPTSVTATSNIDSGARVTWVAPQSTGSSVITRYDVIAQPGTIKCMAPADARSCDVVGLTNGVTYTFTVKAKNVYLWSDDSSMATATPTGTPSAPRNVTATSLENAKSTVTWSAPSSDGSRAITG